MSARMYMNLHFVSIGGEYRKKWGAFDGKTSRDSTYREVKWSYYEKRPKKGRIPLPIPRISLIFLSFGIFAAPLKERGFVLVSLHLYCPLGSNCQHVLWLARPFFPRLRCELDLANSRETRRGRWNRLFQWDRRSKSQFCRRPSFILLYIWPMRPYMIAPC